MKRTEEDLMSITHPTAARVRRFDPVDSRPRQLRPLDFVVAWVGLFGIAVSGSLARDGIAVGERAIFKAINSWPDALYVVIWPFMQYGVFLTIPILVVVAVIVRRYRMAATMALAGIGVYFIARWVKGEVGRGRPAALLDGVLERETFASGSIGFPSGHIAVAVALTVVVTPYLRGRWKLLPAALVVIVAVGRIYVGAHLPLDLIGGAALGASAGAFANLLAGSPQRS
jgi:membrane-associated phospholipid phosphatase